MPYEAPASPPCIASHQDHIHFPIYSGRILKTYFDIKDRRGRAFVRSPAMWLLAMARESRARRASPRLGLRTNYSRHDDRE